jgi:hypothetical protein
VGAEGGGTAANSNSFMNAISAWPRRAQIPHRGGTSGTPRTCRGVFSSPGGDIRVLKRTTPGSLFDLQGAGEAFEDMKQMGLSGEEPLGEAKTKAPNSDYHQILPPVAARQEEVARDYLKRAARTDELNGHPPGSDGPMVTALKGHNGGRVLVFVMSAFAEMPGDVGRPYDSYWQLLVANSGAVGRFTCSVASGFVVNSAGPTQRPGHRSRCYSAPMASTSARRRRGGLRLIRPGEGVRSQAQVCFSERCLLLADPASGAVCPRTYVL